MVGMTWSGEQLDLEAYLARIGFEGKPTPDLKTLRALHRAHVASIPFENLEIVLGRPVLLEIDDLQRKMVRQRRGGYCYEQNSLFAAALERVGFSVTGWGARVRAGARSLRAVTHMVLKVEVDGEQWLCDVGFGGEGLLEPFPLAETGVVRQGGWDFELGAEDEGVRVLRTRRPDGWGDLYAFTAERRHPVDYTLMNYYTSTHPRSSFTGRSVAQRTSSEARFRLVDQEFSVVRADGSHDERLVPAAELPAVLAEVFGIELDADDSAELIRVHSAGV
ncbi:arylamine N-acetyltransferase [Streptomyces sp. T-3]|nr:arylamine N-acetyltransferase [Streptomyces sp. T-3]